MASLAASVPPASPVDKPHVDPVCGMRAATDPDRSFTHRHTTYYFCGTGCRNRFAGDPDHYLAHPPKPRAPAPVVVAAGVQAAWVCPMDPEVLQDHPGACPLCGMALEPRVPTTGTAGNPELVDMTRRLVAAAALTVPLWIVAMAPMIDPSMRDGSTSGPSVRGWSMDAAWMPWIEALLATPVVLVAGWPFLQRAWRSVRTVRLNMFSLIGLGVAVSWGFSGVALLVPDLLPPAFLEHGRPPLYFEAAAGIVTLALVGQVLELRARAKTGDAMRALLDLAPATARRIDAPEPGIDGPGIDGHDVEVPLAEVVVGDRLRVRPGDRVPVDGVIASGSSALDEALVTGESLAVEKGVGQRVVAGSLNGAGSFVMRAEKVGADTLLARIATLVAEAGRSRAPIQRLADRVAGWFVPLVLVAAMVAAVAWLAFGPAPVWPHALIAAISVLIVACPCALGLATPISVTVAVGRGARDGILIKDADALERMAAIDTMVVDKTGTLTERRARVTRIVMAPDAAAGWTDDALLTLVASLEQGSTHPFASAITTAASERLLTPKAAKGLIVVPGFGITGRVDGRTVVAGNAAFLERHGVAGGALTDPADDLRRDGDSALLVAVDGLAIAAIGVADPIRPSARDALAALTRDGVAVVMLTGDHETTAAAIARRLGIDRHAAGLDPAGKQAWVQRLRDEGRIVAMAGDGINDAPALSAADVGIAMGGGTDIAIESARVVLLNGDLAGLVKARRLARHALANIRQNLGFAFVYNAVGVPLAAGILYPFFGLVFGPTVAAVAMSVSSFSVIANALRLRNVKL